MRGQNDSVELCQRYITQLEEAGVLSPDEALEAREKAFHARPLSEEMQTFREGAPTLLQDGDSIINGDGDPGRIIRTNGTPGDINRALRGAVGRTMTEAQFNEAVKESGRTEFEEVVDNIFDEAALLLKRKHHDYGPRNISLSPGGPLNGLRVRMWDKMARINNLVDKDVEPTNESLRDSFIDLLNYSAIALLVLDNNWPET